MLSLCWNLTPQKKTAWSAEEEAIWLSLVEKALRKHLLPIVRADGRLKHRCISTHLGAMVGAALEFR